jgi:hypothetical protein
MNTTETKCPDVLMTGNCTKGQDCQYCAQIDVNLNVNAKNYVPKSKRTDNTSTSTQENGKSESINDKLQLNLNAQEYVPKFGQNLDQQMEGLNVEDGDDEDDIDNEIENEEFDMIMKDIINNEALEEEIEEDESDDEKWFPKYKECECCKGFVYKCQGAACINMGECYCKMKEECDDEDEDM